MLNKSLELLGESPIKKQKVTKQKLEKVQSVIASFAKESTVTLTHQEEYQRDEREMIDQLKVKFLNTKNRSEQFLVLSCLPQSWSRAKIQEEFGVSQFMTRAVQKLVKENGILTCPNPKPGKTLDERVAQNVKDFYQRDDISRPMPGKKDFVVIRKNEGKKEYVQKRLVLANLREIYSLFKTDFPNEKIGFSKFCELRPKNCILAGKSGTHSVCVCTIHQNVKLMLNASKLNKMFDANNGSLAANYYDCLYKIMCNPPSVDCYLGNRCQQCPGVDQYKNILLEKFEEELIEEIQYNKWVSVDRCTMETIVKKTYDFVQELIDSLIKLKSHSFIANMQKEKYNYIKNNLKSGEALITCDFAENYSFVMQDEVQAYHWNNSQATLHPFAIYFKSDDNIQNLNYVCISESLTHNTVAFHLFLSKLMPDLKRKIPGLKKIFYFSDGSAAQYKNKKNFLNVCLHNKDFGIEAEWHFFATSHGKSACDGLGGTVKRLAAKASLQRPYNDQIMTPLQLFTWCQENITGINFKYYSENDHVNHEKYLNKRFIDVLTIPGTQKIHAVIPFTESCFMSKMFSESSETENHHLLPGGEVLSEIQNVESGFVTVEYNKLWWLACILGKNNETAEVKVSFLHPEGPASSFFYPSSPDVLIVKSESLIKKVEPLTATGRTYKLSQKEMMESSEVLKRKLKKI